MLRYLLRKLFALISFFVPKRALGELHYRWNTIDTANKLLAGFLGVFVAVLVSVGYKLSKDHNELRDTRCLAMNVYHEARGEPQEGKYAVAEVTMNRVRSSHYPDDVCEVVYQRAWSKRIKAYISEFSWTTDTNTDIPQNSQAWLNSVRIARDVYYNNIDKAHVADAMYYHADYVNPYWAKRMKKVAKIGKHIFYINAD